jgi:hypothetical protein
MPLVLVWQITLVRLARILGVWSTRSATVWRHSQAPTLGHHVTFGIMDGDVFEFAWSKGLMGFGHLRNGGPLPIRITFLEAALKANATMRRQLVCDAASLAGG